MFYIGIDIGKHHQEVRVVDDQNQPVEKLYGLPI